MVLIIATLCVLFGLGASQKPSPCPEVFSYEPRGTEEDRWYGVISLQTQEDLTGIWIHVVLDRPADLLGNWFGESTSSDNQDFTIKNVRYKLEAGPPVSVRFFVKYNPASTIPSLTSIRLNGRSICGGRQESNTQGPTLHISETKPAPSVPNRPRPNVRPSNTNERDEANGQGENNPQGGGSRHDVSVPINSESLSSSGNGLSIGDSSSNGFVDYFPGDFANGGRPVVNRPTSRPAAINTRNIRCGTVAMRPSPLVSHGQNTSQGQFPWHVALYYSQGIQLMYTCGGTLISENHVITAAHCVTTPQTNRPINPQNILVYLGKYSLKKFGPEVQDREVSDIYVHPQYNYNVFFNDIAILKLGTPADFTNYVRPCCLWEESNNLDDLVDKLGTVVGWGYTENRQLSINLMQAQMPVVSPTTCIYSNREFFSQFTFEKNFCAGFRNGTSVCNGDSGGGMVFPRSGTSGQNTVWQIRGIVSISVALQSQGVCDPSHYIVFTDVAKHLHWIRQTLNN